MAKSGCRESKQPHVDIAIVGSGIAGLYLASRLLSEPVYQVKSIALFDTANRVGGRILSVIVPEVPYIADLGAMRYLPSKFSPVRLFKTGCSLNVRISHLKQRATFCVENTSHKRLSLRRER